MISPGNGRMKPTHETGAPVLPFLLRTCLLLTFFAPRRDGPLRREACEFPARNLKKQTICEEQKTGLDVYHALNSKAE
jgi:hypothetical protein